MHGTADCGVHKYRTSVNRVYKVRWDTYAVERNRTDGKRTYEQSNALYTLSGL